MIRTAAENNKAVRIGVNWVQRSKPCQAHDGCQLSFCYAEAAPEEIMKEALIVSALESAEKSRGFGLA